MPIQMQIKIQRENVKFWLAIVNRKNLYQNCGVIPTVGFSNNCYRF
ncbi:MAG: Uncharacterised protein [Prochlorococcus marinus str. MIT 9215]|nr:MAG: Uncharacterised protein [Prochlorococcus marinus str. MIT 9215]